MKPLERSAAGLEMRPPLWRAGSRAVQRCVAPSPRRTTATARRGASSSEAASRPPSTVPPTGASHPEGAGWPAWRFLRAVAEHLQSRVGGGGGGGGGGGVGVGVGISSGDGVDKRGSSAQHAEVHNGAGACPLECLPGTPIEVIRALAPSEIGRAARSVRSAMRAAAADAADAAEAADASAAGDASGGGGSADVGRALRGLRAGMSEEGWAAFCDGVEAAALRAALQFPPAGADDALLLMSTLGGGGVSSIGGSLASLGSWQLDEEDGGGGEVGHARAQQAAASAAALGRRPPPPPPPGDHPHPHLPNDLQLAGHHDLPAMAGWQAEERGQHPQHPQQQQHRQEQQQRPASPLKRPGSAADACGHPITVLPAYAEAAAPAPPSSPDRSPAAAAPHKRDRSQRHRAAAAAAAKGRARPGPPHFSRIVFGGGGARTLAYAGAVHALRTLGLVRRVDAVAGASGGAILAVLAALNLGPDEVLRAMESLPEAEQLSFIGLGRSLGLASGEGLFTAIERAVAQRTKTSEPTLGDIDAATGVRVVIVATSLARRAPLYLDSRGDAAGMRVRDALRASSAIPFYFPPVRHDDDLLMDGCLTDCTPVGALLGDGVDPSSVLVLAVHDAAAGPSAEPRSRAPPSQPVAGAASGGAAPSASKGSGGGGSSSGSANTSSTSTSTSSSSGGNGLTADLGGLINGLVATTLQAGFHHTLRSGVAVLNLFEAVGSVDPLQFRMPQGQGRDIVARAQALTERWAVELCGGSDGNGGGGGAAVVAAAAAAASSAASPPLPSEEDKGAPDVVGVVGAATGANVVPSSLAARRPHEPSGSGGGSSSKRRHHAATSALHASMGGGGGGGGAFPLDAEGHELAFGCDCRPWWLSSIDEAGPAASLMPAPTPPHEAAPDADADAGADADERFAPRRGEAADGGSASFAA